jgi:hypothetical protein
VVRQEKGNKNAERYAKITIEMKNNFYCYQKAL